MEQGEVDSLESRNESTEPGATDNPDSGFELFGKSLSIWTSQAGCLSLVVRQKMKRLENTRKAIGWLIVAFLLTSVLVNVLGFLSPIVSSLRYDNNGARLEHACDLLCLGQAATPWFYVLYVVAAWYLAKGASGKVESAAVLAVGLLLFLSRTVPSFLPASTQQVSYLVYELVWTVAVFVFAISIWLNLRTDGSDSERAEPGATDNPDSAQ